MRFGDLTYIELRDVIAQDAIALIPTGCTEQQGPHLTVDFDTWLVTAICEAAAVRAEERHGVRVVVLPTVPFGPTPEHRSFGTGFVDLPQTTHEAVIASVLASVADQGFRRAVIWRGCGGHDLAGAVERFNATQDRCRAVQPDLPYRDIWLDKGDVRDEGGHADGFATSLALHLRPESVRTDEIRDPDNRPVDWDDPNLDFGAYSSTGVLGRPTVASAELGATLWEEIVSRTAEFIASHARR